MCPSHCASGGRYAHQQHTCLLPRHRARAQSPTDRSTADYYRVMHRREERGRNRPLGCRTKLKVGSDLEDEFNKSSSSDSEWNSSDEDSEPWKTSPKPKRYNPRRAYYAALAVSVVCARRHAPGACQAPASQARAPPPLPKAAVHALRLAGSRTCHTRSARALRPAPTCTEAHAAPGAPQYAKGAEYKGEYDPRDALSRGARSASPGPMKQRK